MILIEPWDFIRTGGKNSFGGGITAPIPGFFGKPGLVGLTNGKIGAGYLTD